MILFCNNESKNTLNIELNQKTIILSPYSKKAISINSKKINITVIAIEGKSNNNVAKRLLVKTEFVISNIENNNTIVFNTKETGNFEKRFTSVTVRSLNNCKIEVINNTVFDEKEYSQKNNTMSKKALIIKYVLLIIAIIITVADVLIPFILIFVSTTINGVEIKYVLVLFIVLITLGIITYAITKKLLNPFEKKFDSLQESFYYYQKNGRRNPPDRERTLDGTGDGTGDVSSSQE